MNSEHPNNRWYYDACILEGRKSDFCEIFRSNNPVVPVFSHLALGEAFANAYQKGLEPLNAFVFLIESLRSFIEVVQNDGSSKLLEDVKENFELSNTDALHLATAIQNSCVCIKTNDRDFKGLKPKELCDFGKKHGLPQLSINSKSYNNR